MKLVYLVILLVFASSGCVYNQAELDVRYEQDKAKLSPLSSIKPLRVQVGQFEDKRIDTVTIGYQRSGFGTKAGKVITTRPVTEIIHEAIVTVLRKNGHIVTEEQNDLNISGAIETFLFESQMNVLTIEFMGTINVNLIFEDAQTNKTVLSRRYVGHHNAELFSGYHNEIEEVMNLALEDLIDQIATDAQLIEAIKAYTDP